jgi:hypothetical protein
MRAPMILAIALLLSACREAPAPTIDRSNPLEAAAVDANLVDDPGTTPPNGLYEHRHALGTDALCLTGEDADDLKFGVVAIFGSTLICEGRGSAVHDGAQLRLSFDGAECSIDATYDGRSVRMPGTVPDGCAALCGPRASLSGVAVERSGWDDASARGLRSRRDQRALCSQS